jgi:hypothetical protein
VPTVLNVDSPKKLHSDATNSDSSIWAVIRVIVVHVHLGRMVIVLVLTIREPLASSCKKKKTGRGPSRKNSVREDILHCVLRAVHTQPYLAATLLRKEVGVGRKSKRGGWRVEEKRGWVVKWPQLTCRERASVRCNPHQASTFLLSRLLLPPTSLL